MFLEGWSMLCLHTVIWAPVTHAAPTQGWREEGGDTRHLDIPTSWLLTLCTLCHRGRRIPGILHKYHRIPAPAHPEQPIAVTAFGNCSSLESMKLFCSLFQTGRAYNEVPEDAKSVGVSSFMCAALMFWPDLVFILCVFVTETVEITYLIPILGNTASFLWISLLGREEHNRQGILLVCVR